MCCLEKPVRTFILNRKKQSLAIVFFGLMSQMLTIMIPISIGKYYQLAFDLPSRRAQFLDFIPTVWWNSVNKFLLFFLLLIVLRYLFFFVYRYFLKMESERFVLNIKNRLFKHQLSVDYSVYQEKGVGKYLLRYSGDLVSLKNLYLKGGLSVFIDMFILLVAFVWFFALSTVGAVIILCGALLSYVLVYFFNQRLEYYSVEKRDKTAGQLSFVSRTLTAVLTVLLMNKQQTELKKYGKRSASILDSAGGYHRWFVINTGFISFLQYALLTVVLYWFYLSNDMGIGGAELTSFILLYITVLPVIRHLFQLTTVYKLGNLSKNKLNHLLSLPQETVQKGKLLIVEEPQALSVHFKHTDFGTGSINQLISGAGVHTLSLPSNLSHRSIFYALTGVPQSYQGDIYINDINIKSYSLQSLRDAVSTISAQIPLLGRTVYEAITVKRSARTKSVAATNLATVQQALGIAEEKYLSLNDKIGENGSLLTVAQYEMLCLVRGLSANKPIVIVESFIILSDTVVQHLLADKASTIIWLQPDQVNA